MRSAATLWVGMLFFVWGCAHGAADGTAAPDKGVPMTITIKSMAFEPGRPIPQQYTGDGKNISPALTWANVPPQTKELAIIMDDPDAPTPQPWVHWVIYKIQAGTTGLPEGVPAAATIREPQGALQGVNSFGKVGYGGPAPPRGHGVHHYHFKIYALSEPLPDSSGLDKNKLLAAMQGKVLATGEVVGTYER
jgi:Raf kinase inhibitor-like YbhB/YbcL family protein